MGQEIDADTSCEVIENHKTLRLPYTYTTLFIGWILGAVLFFFVAKPFYPSVCLLFFGGM